MIDGFASRDLNRSPAQPPGADEVFSWVVGNVDEVAGNARNQFHDALIGPRGWLPRVASECIGKHNRLKSVCNVQRGKLMLLRNQVTIAKQPERSASAEHINRPASIFIET